MDTMHSYRETTQNIEVSVAPEFLEEHSDPTQSRWVWAYTVEVRNLSDAPVRLRSRHWRITDANGNTEEVQGPGVVGEQPLIDPGRSFRYTSGCPLGTPSGIMVGSYQMERGDGERFEVAIPAFSLDSPGAPLTLN